MGTYDFANILFSGRCNLQCPHCIGHTSALRSMPNNLNTFPLKGLERFVGELNCHGVIQISLTGTNTDPQLYAYEPELIDYLRERIAGVKISLHTNGKLAMQKMEVFNLYDRATISLPSFNPHTCLKMTGSTHVLDLAGIVRVSRIPLKISTVITEHNINEIPSIMARCRELGISRMVLRKLYGETRRWNLFPHLEPVRYFGGNPVYEVDGMEVTIWDFSASRVQCLNLFSDGSISQEYQLTKKEECQSEVLTLARFGLANPNHSRWICQSNGSRYKEERQCQKLRFDLYQKKSYKAAHSADFWDHLIRFIKDTNGS